jgi:hypothetical protein
MVTVEYLKPEQVNGGHLIYMLTKKHAPLMMWNAHLYIVDGITYVGDVDATTGGIMICSNDSIRSLARAARRPPIPTLPVRGVLFSPARRVPRDSVDLTSRAA